MTKRVLLEDIVIEIRNGFDADQFDQQSNGMLPISRIETIWNGTIDFDRVKYAHVTQKEIEKYALKSGDILFSHINSPEHIGKTGLYRSEQTLIHGINLLLIRVDQEKCHPEYLDYYFKSKNVRALFRARCKKAVNQASLNQPDVLSLEVPLPPLTEQKRIASLLARADRLRHLRRTAHELGESLLQSVFLEMFGDVAHSKWEKCELGELIEGFEAGVNYLPVGEGENTSEWRVLKISAVTWGDFDPTESKAISADVEFEESHVVRQGDLLISRANTTELVGAVSLVKNIPPKVLLPDKLWRVKFREESAILPEYILHHLRQPALRKIIGDLATGSSGSMKNISMAKAATLPISVPPLNLQEEFAGVVARVESLRGMMSEGERQVEGLFESLLAESFGE